MPEWCVVSNKNSVFDKHTLCYCSVVNQLNHPAISTLIKDGLIGVKCRSKQSSGRYKTHATQNSIYTNRRVTKSLHLDEDYYCLIGLQSNIGMINQNNESRLQIMENINRTVCDERMWTIKCITCIQIYINILLKLLRITIEFVRSQTTKQTVCKRILSFTSHLYLVLLFDKLHWRCKRMFNDVFKHPMPDNLLKCMLNAMNKKGQKQPTLLNF